jgi:dihydroflavonol-4-reductase
MILVTGGTGLVGAHLLLYLVENGHDVRATYRQARTIKNTMDLFGLYLKDHLFSQIEWIQADVTDLPKLEMAFEDIEYVYHCAGFISFDPKKEEQLRKINIEGTANIVNLCIDHKVKKLCHVSSISALGDLAQNESYVSETSEWNPEVYHSDYAISKYGAELEVWRGYQEGLPVVIVNPGVILGPTIWKEGSGAIFTQVEKGISFFTRGKTGFVGVNDVVKVMHILMQSDIEGERFSLVAENLTYEEIIKSIAAKTESKMPKYHAKPWVTNIAWRLDWMGSVFFGKKRKLTKYTAQTLHSITIYNSDKIKNPEISGLGFKFQSIDAVIQDVADYRQP